MKNIYLSIALFLVVNIGFGQTAEWATQLIAPEFTSLGGMVIDTNGDILIAGNYSDELFIMEESSLSSSGPVDFFIARYNETGQVLWAKSYGGDGFEGVNGMSMDGDGNLIITGDFSETTSLDGTVLQSAGFSDSYVAKLNTSGDLIWVNRIGNEGFDFGNSAVVDHEGNVIVSGSFSGSLTIADETVVAVGMDDAYRAKFNSEGTLEWLRSFGSVGQDYSGDAATDGNGNLYCTGSFSGTISFAGEELSSQGLADCYLLKYDGNGNELWAKRGGGENNTYGTHLIVQEDGQLLLMGSFESSATFEGIELGDGINPANLFIAEFENDGSLIWAKSVQNTSIPLSLSIDDSGNIFATSFFEGDVEMGGFSLNSAGMHDMCIIKLDTLGDLVWVRAEGGPGNDYPQQLVASGNGDYILGGDFGESLNFGEYSVEGGFEDPQDIFLASFNSGMVGVGEFINADPIEVLVYPNPTNSQLNFKSPDELIAYEIYDAQGRLLESQGLNSNIGMVDLSHFTTGVFTICFENKSRKKISQRFMLK